MSIQKPTDLWVQLPHASCLATQTYSLKTAKGELKRGRKFLFSFFLSLSTLTHHLMIQEKSNVTASVQSLQVINNSPLKKSITSCWLLYKYYTAVVCVQYG